MTKYLATVHIILEVEDQNQAFDALSGLLTECGMSDPLSGIFDWSYTKPAKSAPFSYPVPVKLPYDYEIHEGNIADLVLQVQP